MAHAMPYQTAQQDCQGFTKRRSRQFLLLMLAASIS